MEKEGPITESAHYVIVALRVLRSSGFKLQVALLPTWHTLSHSVSVFVAIVGQTPLCFSPIGMLPRKRCDTSRAELLLALSSSASTPLLACCPDTWRCAELLLACHPLWFTAPPLFYWPPAMTPSRFLQYCRCETCVLGCADASRGKPWSDRLQWNLHSRSVRNSRTQSAAHPADSSMGVTPSIEDRSTGLFASVLVGDTPDPSRMTLTARSVIEMSTIPTPDSIAMEDLLESFSRIQFSTPPNDTSLAGSPAMDNLSESLANVQLHTSYDSVPTPSFVPSTPSVASMADKRDNNVASKRSLQALTHIEDHILVLEKSLMAPSEEQLGSAEADLSRLRSMFSRITRNTTMVLARKEEIGRHLQRIDGRICEMRHLMPVTTLSNNARVPIPYECGKSTF